MADDPPRDRSSGSWWTTLPGVLTAVAGFLTAVTGLVVAIHQLTSGSDNGSLPAAASVQATGPVQAPATPPPADTGTSDSGQVTFPSGRKVTLGDFVYEIRGAQLDRRNPAENDLKLVVRMTNNGQYGANFWDRSFRLVVDGAARAPVGGLNDIVEGRSSGDGTVVFVVPATAGRLTLVVGDTADRTEELPLVVAAATG
jgi:hypothetical protein